MQVALPKAVELLRGRLLEEREDRAREGVVILGSCSREEMGELPGSHPRVGLVEEAVGLPGRQEMAVMGKRGMRAVRAERETMAV
jgi:hypothetical protein